MIRILKKIKCISYVILKKVFLLIPLNKNKIVFSNFFGKAYGDNPKYIAEEFLKRNLDMDLVWLVNDLNQKVPEGIRLVKYNSLKSVFEYSTAKVIIQNIRNGHLNKIRKNQVYLQTWHGGRALKYIEKQSEKLLSPEYINSAKYDGSISTGIISDSEFQSIIYKEAFWLSDKTEILNFGLPRNDALINNKGNIKLVKKVRKEIKVKDTDFLILYAPTFRDDGSKDGYILNFDALLKSLENKFNKKCKILVRFHPNFKNDIVYNNVNVIDVCKYGDVQELALACDCVISDYSSVIFDFLILDKYIFLISKDIEEYSKLRGLSKKYFELPFPRGNNESELSTLIDNFDEKKYNEIVNKYNKKYPDYNDGKASKNVVDWILKRME